jgi:hypothetical protein
MDAVQSFKEVVDMAGPPLLRTLMHFLGVRDRFVGCGGLALLLVLLLARQLTFQKES